METGDEEFVKIINGKLLQVSSTSSSWFELYYIEVNIDGVVCRAKDSRVLAVAVCSTNRHLMKHFLGTEHESDWERILLPQIYTLEFI